MSLAPYLVTSLSRNDITEAPKDRNVVIGAIVEFRQGGVPQTIYDDAGGSNPATQKVTDSNGQLNAWVEVGDYELSVNGVVKNISVNKNLLPNDINGVVERVGDLDYSIREIETDQSAPGSTSSKLMTAKQINSIIDATASDLESAIATPKPILSIPFGINQTEEFLNGSVSCVRSTVKNYTDIYGVLREAPVNTLAVEKGGALIEGSSTNLLLYSEDLSNVLWDKFDCTSAIDGTSSPSLSLTANKLTEGSNSGIHRITQVPSSIPLQGEACSFSFYFKPAERKGILIRLINESGGQVGARFDSSTGDFFDISPGVSAKKEVLGNGWYRLCISYTFSSTITTPVAGQCRLFMLNDALFEIYQGDGVSGVYLWGFQFEKIGFCTSYISTTTSSATRAADVVTIPTLNNYLGQNEGGHSIYIKASSKNQVATVLNAKSTTGQNEKYRFQINNDRGEFSNGSTSTTNTPTTTAGNLNSYALTFNGVESLAYVSGVSGTAGLSAADSELDTTSPLTIGSTDSGASNNMYGHVKDLKVFNVSLSATQIKGLG